MPGGYRLDVVCSKTGEMFSVRVPKDGVAAGTTFIASEVVKKPVTGRWYNDIFGVAPSLEGNFFTLACCFPAISIAVILDKLVRDCFGMPRTPFRGGVTIGVVTILTVVFVSLYVSGSPGNSAFLIALYFCFLEMTAKLALREKYSIPGYCLQDCCVSYWCSCCSALQMFRHMKMSGEEPKCCAKHVEATMV
jgi:Cys-rich protein (TIGR01571 family)